jgi:hypothetical protein
VSGYTRILETGGIRHEDFWNEVEKEVSGRGKQRVSTLRVASVYIRVRTHIKIRMGYRSRASRVYPSRFFNVVKTFTFHYLG